MRATADSNTAIALVTVACLVLAGCQSGGGGGIIGPGDDPPQAFDMSGTWIMTLNVLDPPFAFDCTGDLTGMDFSFCESFEVSVVQDGVVFLPDQDNGPSEQFCDSLFIMTGSATVPEIHGVISRARVINLFPPEFEYQNLEFQAGVVANSGTFALVKLTLQDVTGECTLGGSYLGLRTSAP